MLNRLANTYKYPYPAFAKPEPRDSRVALFHLECPETKQLICYCDKTLPKTQIADVETALNIDIETISKRRKLGRERFFAIARPATQIIEPVTYDKRMCQNCWKQVSYYIKQSNKYYCVDCLGDPESQQRKLVTVSSRRKRIGTLLAPGTTLSELGRRGRPRIYNRDEDDSLSCYFPKCQRRSIRFDNDPDILRCTECRRTYHAKCSDPPLNHMIVAKFEWQCLDCKRCISCGKTKEDSPLILCESCDRPFHVKCAKATTAPFHCSACITCTVCLEVLPPPEDVASEYWQKEARFCENCWVKREPLG
mmetsp:Transcript_24023/g.42668  ORF Transcript_24023/g.42668 Transcript_24023/m.42668 type:complete len:307 (-) Transcript_24023:2768-3688(-)